MTSRYFKCHNPNLVLTWCLKCECVIDSNYITLNKPANLVVTVTSYHQATTYDWTPLIWRLVKHDWIAVFSYPSILRQYKPCSNIINKLRKDCPFFWGDFFCWNSDVVIQIKPFKCQVNTTAILDYLLLKGTIFIEYWRIFFPLC